MDRFFDEYVVEQVADFEERVERILPIREWDMVSYAFIWQLGHDPTFSAHNVDGDQWVIVLDGPPRLTVFYTIDETAKVVTLADVRRR